MKELQKRLQATFAPEPLILTPEQHNALLAFSLQHGRYWKSKLQRLWVSGKDTGVLRQIRNDFGPQWLKSFHL